MATSKDPTAREFYVYVLEAEGTPFYVGIGRSTRASDRVRYVRYLMKRTAEGNPVKKWGSSSRAVAHFLRQGKDVTYRYLHELLTRPEALALEIREIDRLVARGIALANIQHNRHNIPRITFYTDSIPTP